MATYYIPSADGWQANGGGIYNTYLRIKVTQSYNPSTNKSSIKAEIQVRNQVLKLTWYSVNDNYRSFNANGHSLTLTNDFRVQTNSDATWRTLAYGSTTGLSYTLDHDASGAATVTASVNVYLYGTYGGREYNSVFKNLSGSVALSEHPLHTLHIPASVGASVSVSRIESAGGYPLGSLYDGASIYGGDKLSFSYEASEGYYISTHTVNGVEQFSGTKITVDGDVNIVVTASVKNWPISISPGTGSTLSVVRVERRLFEASTGLHQELSDGDLVYYGDVLEISGSAQSGYIFGTCYVNGEPVSGQYVVTSMTTVTATATQAGAWLYDSSQFASYQSMIFNGTAWEAYIPYVYTGSQWEVF